jgi:3-oxoacyl-[acyl-carrier-protein] synthase-3
LAIEAGNLLIKENNIEKESIDFLLYCTQSPDYFLPTTACILQDKLGLKRSIGALDINLGCSGYVYGLSLAKGLILAGAAKNILLVTADTYSKFIHPSDKSNITLFGDAASATLISCEENGEGMEICEFVFGTDGSGANNLIVKNGGLRNPVLNGMDEEEEGAWIKNDNHLFMNGNAIFQFTTSFVPSLVNQYFIRKKIGIPSDKFCIDLEMTGNTVSSTIPIALFESIKSKRIQLGHKVLLAGFGVGYSWGGVILKYQDT